MYILHYTIECGEIEYTTYYRAALHEYYKFLEFAFYLKLGGRREREICFVCVCDCVCRIYFYFYFFAFCTIVASLSTAKLDLHNRQAAIASLCGGMSGCGRGGNYGQCGVLSKVSAFGRTPAAASREPCRGAAGAGDNPRRNTVDRQRADSSQRRRRSCVAAGTTLAGGCDSWSGAHTV